MFHESSKTTIVMLGNSLTEFGGSWNSRLDRSDVKNCGQSGFITSQILRLLKTCVLVEQPRACFVMGGINDLAMGFRVPGIFENHKKIIQELKAGNIMPVFQSTLYVHGDPEINRHVTHLNKLLEDFCRENDVHFIDLNASMSGDNGLLPEFTFDGIHLTEQGYDGWSRELKMFIKKHSQLFENL